MCVAVWVIPCVCVCVYCHCERMRVCFGLRNWWVWPISSHLSVVCIMLCCALHDIAVLICTLMSIYWKTINKHKKKTLLSLRFGHCGNCMHTHRLGWTKIKAVFYTKQLSLFLVILNIHQLEGKCWEKSVTKWWHNIWSINMKRIMFIIAIMADRQPQTFRCISVITLYVGTLKVHRFIFNINLTCLKKFHIQYSYK